MFIFDFAIRLVIEEALDWCYQTVVALFCELFTLMNAMGLELLDFPWVKAVILLFYKFGWALYIVGFVVAVFECAIEYQSGRGNLKDLFLNSIKGFMAVSLFTVLPVELYKMAIGMQGRFIVSLGLIVNPDQIGLNASDVLSAALSVNTPTPGVPMTAVDMLLILGIVIAYGYAVTKVFFSNLKRGGILVIQIAVGSLYLFSIPRGYIDPFKGWAKTVIGLCLTTFLQSIVLTAGLIVFREHMILGLGMLLSASEVPRICGQFGLDTGTKANIMGGVHAAQAAVNVTRTIAKAII